MAEQYIFRTKVEKEYTTIRNSLIDDKSLSWEARGLLVYLLSKPETWIVMKQDLINASPAASKKTTSILKELETSCYINRKQFRNIKGQWEWHTWVYDQPTPPPVLSTILPKRVHGVTIPPLTAHGETAHGEGDHILSIELKKNESVKNEKEKTTVTIVADIFSLYQNEIGKPEGMEKNMLYDVIAEYPQDWIKKGIKECAVNNIRNMGYLKAVLAGMRKRNGEFVI